MKKWIITMLLLVFSVGAKAQFEAGTGYVGASVSNLGLSYSTTEKFRFGANLSIGTFLADQFMLRADLGYNHTDAVDDFSTALMGRYYFMENGEWKRATSGNRPKLTNFGACLISVLKLPVYEGWAGVTMNITGADEEVADGIDHAELLPEQETISYSLDGREAPATHQGVKVVKVKGSKEVKKILR